MESNTCGTHTSGEQSDIEDAIPIECATKVFNQELLRKIILHHAIHDAKGKVSPTMVTAVRTVQKSWLDTTSRLLVKLDNPVILLDENSLPSFILRAKALKKKGGLLEKFIKVFSDPAKIQQSFLPFKLVINREYFRRDKFQIVLECLRSTGKELMELDIKYPTDAMGIPALNFPFLRKLTFQFCHDNQGTPKKSQLNSDYNHNSVYSLQLILRGSKGLKELIIPFNDFYTDKVPEGIQFLHLPDTLVALEIGQKLTGEEIEAMVLQLTKLESLKITHAIPFEDRLIYKIMERFRETLKCFHVLGIWRTRGEEMRLKTYMQFPVMAKLKTLSLNSGDLELGSDDFSALTECLPNLNTLELRYQPENMLERWLDNYQSAKVETLHFSVINEQLEWFDDDLFLSVKEETMRKVTIAFPNLRELIFDLHIEDLRALKYVFKEMKQLVSLQINLRGFVGGDGVKKMEEMMCGLPMEVLKALKYLKSFEMHDDEQVGVANLLKLESLTLWTNDWDNAEPEEERRSLLSDSLFEQAFLKMRKLRNLVFFGKFKPSAEMQEEWEGNEGCVMEYYPK